MNNQYKLIVCLFLFFNLGSSESNNLIVKTNWGLIKGFNQVFNGIEIKSYLGIPYGLPPVGPLRFAKPVGLHRNHFGVYHANKFGPACLQTELNGAIHAPNSTISENCLFLNVWTPIDASPSNDVLYPVFVYIHGAAFIFGSASGSRSRGDVLTAHTNIVTVNLNHRLGATGFAYGGSDSIVGNQAIHDVLLALKWIKSNIKAFGGDPDQVTLAGMSSGAIIASAIFMSPALDSKLFNKLVLMSGVPAEQTNTKDSVAMKTLTKSMSRSLKCSKYSKKNSSFDIRETICLKTVKSKLIADTIENSDFNLVHGDQYVFPTSPSQIINSKSFPSGYKILVGTEADEALVKLKPNSIAEAIDGLSGLLKTANLTMTLNITDLASEYFKGVNDSDISTIRRKCNDFISDFMFHCPSLLYSLAFATNGANTVHFYRNDYVTSYFTKAARPYGAAHADDHRMFLGEPFRSPEMYSDENDQKLSQYMMNILADFVKGKELFWSPIKVTGSQPDQISLPRWRIQNNETFNKVDQDDDREICLEWAKYLNLKI